MVQIDITVLFQLIYDLLTGGADRLTSFFPLLPTVLFWYKIGAYIFTTISACFAAYLLSQILKIRQQERADLGAVVNIVSEVSSPVNPHWQAIKDKIQSDNPADWQWAIIEADKILEEMVKRMGYLGANLGERLKAVEPSDFLTLNEAWEAHKVRNQIAHEPGFVMDRHKAALTISRFERVFNEFGYI